jgi:hypothetical protein
VAWSAAPRITFISLAPPPVPGLPELPPTAGSESGRGPSGGLGAPVARAAPHAPPAAPPVPAVPSPASIAPPAWAARDSTGAPEAGAARVAVPAPRLADSRIWPAPRPALPGEVADALYHPHDSVPTDSAVVRRLRAMVDSLNQIIDLEQREHRLPSWTTDVGGKKVGIDSSGIYIAGIKIPTPVLALLSNSLPQGNFDASLRARQLADMREDLLQAARRTETLQEFRRYVHDIRVRKQAERDAERRARGDTTQTRLDTAKAVP